LWFVLVNDLRVEWTVNPQYGYGWAVPFLCAFLIWQRIQKPDFKSQSSGDRLPSSIFYFLLALGALLYAPTRLVEEANPDWRLVSWALAIEVIGLTLCLLRLALPVAEISDQQSEISPTPHASRLTPHDYIFPICFFLVAVPWPTWIEQTLIQALTRADASASVELLGWFGIPAMPHGNVIEVSTGTVGIDEACSGIRSFQATLMISLFLGEFYRLNFVRRASLVLGGFALSFFFNLARMTLLVWVAARKGVTAIAAWHDPAGVTILLGCFFGLWGLGVWLKCGMRSAECGVRNAQGGKCKTERERQKSDFRILVFSRITPHASLALIFWILLTEISIEVWYRSHEARSPRATPWAVAWPTNNPTFKEFPLTGSARQILRYDEGRSAAWSVADQAWQAIFLRWNPGRTALHLAQNHTPEVCLTAAGHALNVIAPQQWFEVSEAPDTAGTNYLRLPFAIYEVKDAAQPFYVFYCLWDDRASAQGFETMSLTASHRLAPVLAGLRNPGQRSLEIALTGPATAEAAETAVRAELNQLIKLQ
jgi:exosortase/archaeosortase family protein